VSDDNLNMDDTRRMLRDSVRTFVARESDLDRARAVRLEALGFDRAVWRGMAENGWLGLLFPEDFGGVGLGFGEACVVMEELGRALVSEPVVPASVLAGAILRDADNAALRAEKLPAVIAGTLIPAVAWQEARNAYDPDAIEMRAGGSGDGVRLSGSKMFIPAAAGADAFIVSALGADGIGLYWVENAAAGLTLTLDETVDGVAYGSIALDGAAAEAVATVGADGILARAVDEARLCVSAELVGVMSEALDVTLGYVKQREQFGRPIGKFQALQHRLVDLFVQQELSRNTVAQAVAIFDETTDPVRRAGAVSAAKARCSDAALLITRQGIQLHGGIGYTDECDIGLFLKRALVLSAWLGNASVHRGRFARYAPLATA
jgi:alkylation response protein AidB-like acyl-CoA dehydrogenase